MLLSVVRPRPTQATSVPALIQLFQNEWDALMVETYTLKQHLAHTRKARCHDAMIMVTSPPSLLCRMST